MNFTVEMMKRARFDTATIDRYVGRKWRRREAYLRAEQKAASKSDAR